MFVTNPKQDLLSLNKTGNNFEFNKISYYK